MADAMRRASRTLLAPALLAAAALAGPLLAPYAPEEQLDPAAGALLPPGSVRDVARLADGRTLLVADLELRRAGAGEPRWRGWRLGEPVELADAELVARERRLFLLGTDRFGRDVFSRLLAGARPSLAIGGLAAALALALGLLAALAAAAGPWTARAADWLTDGLLSVPRLFLLLGVAAALPLGPVGLVVVLALTSWMPTARLIAGEILSGEAGDVAAAARASGASRTRILLRHLVPAALPAAVTDTALRAGDFVLLEAALSFLGAGIQPPRPSWGNMVAESADVLVGAWWLALFPGLALLAAVGVLSFWADGLRDRLDPGRR